jgi:hypothetical protein
MTDIEARLARLRGAVPPRPHNARTIAALTSNPGCVRRAVLDAAGVDKQGLAAHLGFPARFGQSQFAIGRGKAFEALVKANGCAELLTLLRAHLGLPIPEASYDDLETVGDNATPRLRHGRTRALLARAAARGGDAGTLFDHPMLRIEVGGRTAYLEPDLVAFQLRGRFHVVEIKSFAIVDGQADSVQVMAAAIQAAVYVLALRSLLTELGMAPDAVSHDVVLVCPEDFSNRPRAAILDIRKQLTVLRRQLSRLARIDSILAELPADASFDLAPDENDNATRSPAALAESLRHVEARYAPECLASCEMAYYCRYEGRDHSAALGRTVHDELGGVESIATAVGLATGIIQPATEQADAAGLLRLAERLRRESLGRVA